jgi:hypothetical protein
MSRAAVRAKKEIPQIPVKQVPFDLCRDTVHLLTRLPMGEIYLLAKRWEKVCPELFVPNTSENLENAGQNGQ